MFIIPKQFIKILFYSLVYHTHWLEYILKSFVKGFFLNLLGSTSNLIPSASGLGGFRQAELMIMASTWCCIISDGQNFIFLAAINDSGILYRGILYKAL